MLIRRLRIEEFRKLRGPVCLDGLGAGLTVIAGDNEEGKSTILEAIRAVLFCRHRADDTYARGLAPFDCSGGRPRIELDFVIGGHDYRLRKAFCRKPQEALLAGAGRTLNGDAAEEELCRLLGLAAVRKGATKPEEQGVWGLFWVSQATCFAANAQISEPARGTLADALEEEMGRVLGGDRAPALIERIRALSEEVWTPTGRMRKGGPLDRCRDRADAAAQRVTELRGRVEDYRKKVEDLERLRAERARHEREQALEHALLAQRLALEEKERRDLVLRRVEVREKEFALAEARFKGIRERWKQRKDLMDGVQAAEEAEGARAAALARAQAGAAPLRARLAGAEAALAEAQARDEAAAERLTRANVELQRARAADALFLGERALRQAQAAEEAAVAAMAEAQGIRVDDAAIAALRQAMSGHGEARARLQAAETEVLLLPDPGRRVFDGAREIAVEEPLRLALETTLRLEGFGRIVIRPGGEDLAARQQGAREAEAMLCQRLAGLGVPDLAAAEALHRRRQHLLGLIETEQRVVASHAPAGIAALREAVAATAAEVAALAPPDAPPPAVAEAAQAAADDAAAEREAAARALGARRQDRDAAVGRLAEAERTLTELAARAAEAAKQTKQCRETLANARTVAGADSTLLSQLQDEQDNMTGAGALLQQAKETAAACDPEAAAREAEAAKAHVEDLRALLGRLDVDASALAGALQTLGAEGVEEELAQAQGALSAAMRELDAVERRASALRLLFQTLRDAEQEAKRSFAAPLARRIEPYLETLFPGCELAFEADIARPKHLRRQGLNEPFEHLSVGTREQLAVLTRLAFAELLGERGQPAAVILDDALAYSDPKRLERMQQALLRAAERLQVIVLTCRPDDYAGLKTLGVPVRRLADCFAPEPVT